MSKKKIGEAKIGLYVEDDGTYGIYDATNPTEKLGSYDPKGINKNCAEKQVERIPIDDITIEFPHPTVEEKPCEGEQTVAKEESGLSGKLFKGVTRESVLIITSKVRRCLVNVLETQDKELNEFGKEEAKRMKDLVRMCIDIMDTIESNIDSHREDTAGLFVSILLYLTSLFVLTPSKFSEIGEEIYDNIVDFSIEELR